MNLPNRTSNCLYGDINHIDQEKLRNSPGNNRQKFCFSIQAAYHSPKISRLHCYFKSVWNTHGWWDVYWRVILKDWLLRARTNGWSLLQMLVSLSPRFQHRSRRNNFKYPTALLTQNLVLITPPFWVISLFIFSREEGLKNKWKEKLQTIVSSDKHFFSCNCYYLTTSGKVTRFYVMKRGMVTLQEV